MVAVLQTGVKSTGQADVTRHHDRLDVERCAIALDDSPRSVSDRPVLNQHHLRCPEALPGQTLQSLLQMPRIIAPVGRHQNREFRTAQTRPFNPASTAPMRETRCQTTH